MQLKDYMNDKGLTLKVMGELLAQVSEDGIPALESPVTPPTVRRHREGFDHPSPDLVRRYRHATGGMVRPEDWNNLAIKLMIQRDAPVEKLAVGL